ncbi:hypothetical protein [uncultured Cellulomonas sp.]|uniref:hypothetical protein n=1 Tax=uncultured Cellulomonas sp. TaxID=189682 RepID=UPI0028E2F08B|nr:hypothetical protein [uncultured Cellulomonas sp.]
MIAAFSTPFGTVVGVSLTGIGLVVAIAIYIRQGVDSQAKHDELMETWRSDSEALRTELTKFTPVDVDEDEDDPYAEASRGFEHYTAATDDLGVVHPGDVPLAVLADLLAYWESRHETGRWRVRNLVGAARRTGRGNHPWIVAFRGRDGDLRYWRVSRGGRGKSQATVEELNT